MDQLCCFKGGKGKELEVIMEDLLAGGNSWYFAASLTCSLILFVC